MEVSRKATGSSAPSVCGKRYGQRVSNETITRDELDWVLKRHGGRLNAAELMDEIEANRDSTQYEAGGVYQDPEGSLWVFDRALGDDSPHWLRPGIAGPFEYVTPRRPLRRLVPVEAS